MDRASRQLRTTLLLLGDFILLYLALFLTLKLRYGFTLEPDLWWDHVRAFTPVFGLWLIVFAAGGLYDISIGGGRMQLATRLGGTLAVAGAIGTIYFYIGSNRFFSLRPQTVLAVLLGVMFCGLLAWRVVFLTAIRSRRLSRRVLFVGTHAIIPELISELYTKPQFGFTAVAWLQPNGERQFSQTLNDQHRNLPVYQRVSELQAICQRHQVDLIVSDISPRHHQELLRELLACLRLQIDFSDLSRFYERITGKVPVDAIEQVWFLENLQEGTKRPYEFVKWLIDIGLAATLLLISILLLPLFYLMMKITSPGAFLFKQVRVGKAGRPFTAMKIRTMVADAEKSGPQWASPNDQRVTPLGRMLRSIRLDEIPQLINVLRGEMSLIGPRPERPEFIEQLKTKIPFYEERLLVKPGLTGWAQVNFPYGASIEDALEKLQYDLFYIKHRSIGLDLAIALRTIGTMLSRKG